MRGFWRRLFHALTKTFGFSPARLPGSGLLSGQTSLGTVTGLVTDTRKASVPNANVDLTALGTNGTLSTETKDGDLPAGTQEITGQNQPNPDKNQPKPTKTQPNPAPARPSYNKEIPQ